MRFMGFMGFMRLGSKVQVQGARFRVQGARFRVQGFTVGSPDATPT